MRVGKSGNLSFMVLIWILCLGCTGSLTKEDYIRWVRDYDHGLHVNKKTGEFEFDVQYQPVEYVRIHRGLQEGSNEKAENESGDKLQYFLLTIGMADKSIDFINYGVKDIREKQKKLYYFSYQFQEDIQLEESGQKMPCVLYHFEKPVDLRGKRTILLGFERGDMNSDKCMLIIDSEQFGSLPVKIKILKSNIPHLKL